jgi:hypothetical protein
MQIVNPSGRDNPDLKAPLLLMAGSDDRLAAAQGEMLLELVRHLEAQGPAPRATGRVALAESVRPVLGSVRSGVGGLAGLRPLQNGLPLMHYRIQVRRPGSSLSADARARSPEEVEQVIRQAFGWT